MRDAHTSLSLSVCNFHRAIRRRRANLNFRFPPPRIARSVPLIKLFLTPIVSSNLFRSASRTPAQDILRKEKRGVPRVC